MYNQNDIKEMFSKFTEFFSNSVTEELQYFTNLNAIYLQLLFHSAEKSNITLNADTSQVENMYNQKQMNDLINMLTQPSIPELGKKGGIGKLSSISSTQNLIEEFEDLKEKHAILNSTLENYKHQIDMLSKENENLKQNNNSMSNEIGNLSTQIGKLAVSNSKDSSYLDSVKKLEKELTETKAKLDSQINKYQELMNEYDKKLSESVQFKQLKKFITEKNSVVVELKKKLSEYENKK